MVKKIIDFPEDFYKVVNKYRKKFEDIFSFSQAEGFEVDEDI